MHTKARFTDLKFLLFPSSNAPSWIDRKSETIARNARNAAIAWAIYALIPLLAVTADPIVNMFGDPNQSIISLIVLITFLPAALISAIWAAICVQNADGGNTSAKPAQVRAYGGALKLTAVSEPIRPIGVAIAGLIIFLA